MLMPIATFLVAAALIWGGRIVALKYGFSDKPGGRKRHDQPVPPIGGLVIIPVFAVFSQMAGLYEIVPISLLTGLFALLIMGAIDDAVTIKPSIKFVIMLWTCCFVVIFGEGQIITLGNLFGFGEVQLGFMKEAFTVMAIVLLMNSINMIDGVDGLAGGFCTLVTFWFLVLCYGAGYGQGTYALALLLAALVAFLCFNLRHPFRKKASVFLGDSGALCLGLLIGWFAVKLSQEPHALMPPATMIWIIALPVMDAFGLFIARSLRGLHPFNADRRHLHHRFIDAGISPINTTFIMLVLYSLTAVIGFAAAHYGVPPVVLFWGWMVLFIAHTVGIIHPRGYTFASRYFRMKLRKSKG